MKVAARDSLLCATPLCGNVRRVAVRSRFCCSCLSRQADARRPLRRAFRNLKASATRRGKRFTLTFEEFAAVAIEGGYTLARGRSAAGLHIDRKDDRRGYEPGNIQVLSNVENQRRRWLPYRDFEPSEGDVPAGASIVWEEVA